jgi:hypothetical protein
MAVALFTKHNFCNDTMVSNKNPTKYLVFEGIKKCILVCEGYPLVSIQESCTQEQPVTEMLKTK